MHFVVANFQRSQNLTFIILKPKITFLKTILCTFSIII